MDILTLFESMHLLSHNAVTGYIPFDITPMEHRWYPLVPSKYARDFLDILCQATLPFVF